MINDLLRRAAEIRDEDRDFHNTAMRVGRLFIDIIRSHQHVEESLSDFEKEMNRWRWLQIQRGEWSEAVAQDDPYRFYDKPMLAPDGVSTYNQVVQHVVYRFGLKWGCLTDKTLNPPSFDSRDWLLLQDFPNYIISIFSENGSSFRPKQVDTHLDVSVLDGPNDITEMLKATEGVKVQWFRQTTNTSEDVAWQPSFDEGDDLFRIHIRLADMGVNWIYGYREVTFICRVTIPAGKESVVLEPSKFTFR